MGMCISKKNYNKLNKSCISKNRVSPMRRFSQDSAFVCSGPYTIYKGLGTSIIRKPEEYSDCDWLSDSTIKT